jgi:hypothetical protein
MGLLSLYPASGILWVHYKSHQVAAAIAAPETIRIASLLILAVIMS